MAAEPDAGGQSRRLELLGRWHLSEGNGRNAARLNDIPRRLVAMLGLRGPLSRAQVAGILWPEVDDAVAGARLRTLLWRVAGHAMLCTDEGMLALAPDIKVDVVHMRQAASDLDAGISDGFDAALFEHDLLPGWYDDWLEVDRERVRQTRLHALERLAMLRVREGRFAAALDAGLAAVRADPLRETAHRVVIAVHVAEGNVHDAVRQYEACRVSLAVELGIEPSAQLTELLPRMRRGDRALTGVRSSGLGSGRGLTSRRDSSSASRSRLR